MSRPPVAEASSSPVGATSSPISAAQTWPPEPRLDDLAPGFGWWKANDGKWYPPVQYGGGYPPMPPAPWRLVERGPAPRSVLYAVWLMFARPAVGVLGILVGFTYKDTLRQDVVRRSPSLDAAQVNAAVIVATILVVVYVAVFLVLYVVLALQLKKGKRWAHIATLVVVSLGLLLNLLSLSRAAPAVSHVIIAVDILIDVGVIVLLAQKISFRYFNLRP